ncbi:sodium:proton antiporter [Taibaiella sp. KBW10]|uniref:cation:proton antiporter n=1 Tax=Taibaiella sp. KBW10 TaxID=2153357 RepID=UPI000F5B03F1|nr:sodium:proton antiporter [Taibaiella sp. KBW10]RQO30330.1 sodium:proton antiporter [Taibaiella sp. KBW10]
MELYYSFSILIVLAAVFAYINARFLKLPSVIGIMVISMLFSIGLVTTGRFFPKTFSGFLKLLSGFDFTELLMGAMLNFLLFAGAIHIRLKDLKEQMWQVLTLSTVSVIISTIVVGYLFHYGMHLIGLEVPFIHCLLFGALISPTDPIAVLSILKQTKVAKSLQTKIAGESLFNDGVAIVLFILLRGIAEGSGVDVTPKGITLLFVQEAIGGIALGLLLGYFGSLMIKQIDDYTVDVLITLAIVMGGYLIAHELHVSGPLAMVAAGLIVGNFGRDKAMSQTSREYVDRFWELNDEILNAILFLFIGFEVLLIPEWKIYWLPGIIAIVIVLFSRFISIVIPARLIKFKQRLSNQSLIILVWGGLRGGVSIALASSLSETTNKHMILTVTYFVVIFSIIVQGLTVGKLTGPRTFSRRRRMVTRKQDKENTGIVA